MLRVQHFPLSQVPDQLEASGKYEKAYLFRGHVVNRYTGGGAVVVAHIQQKTQHIIPNASPVIALVCEYPKIITFHQSEVIQIYNIETKQCEQQQQEKDTVSRARCALANSKIIVAILLKKILIWERDPFSKAPKTLELEGAPTIAAISESKSAILPGSRLLIANNNPGGHLFQVWDLQSGKIVAYAENPSATETAFTFTLYQDTILTSLKDTIHIWNVSDKTGALSPIAVKFSNCVVSAVHIDAHFLIVGDNFGRVTLHSTSGKLIYYLHNVKTTDNVSLDDMDLTQLSLLFASRVTNITRVGRWVVCAFEDSRIEIYDIYSSNISTACDSYIHPVAAKIREFQVFDSKIYMNVYVTPPVDAKAPTAKAPKPTKPDVVVWEPKLHYEGFDYWATDSDTCLCSCLEISSYGLTTLCQLLQKMDSVRADETKPLVSSVNACIPSLKSAGKLLEEQKVAIPFLVLQKLQNDVDAFEAYLTKVHKQGSSLRLGKVKDHLETLHGSLVRSVQMIVSTCEFVSDALVKLGSSIDSPTEKFIKLEDTVTSASPKLSRSKRRLKKKKTETSTEEVIKDRAINALSLELLRNLGIMYDSTTEQIEQFDQVCHNGIPDPDKALPLLRIYAKLRQMVDDTREAAKALSTFRGEEATGEWWETSGPSPLASSIDK